jgi:hypothetical protein
MFNWVAAAAFGRDTAGGDGAALTFAAHLVDIVCYGRFTVSIFAQTDDLCLQFTV